MGEPTHCDCELTDFPFEVHRGSVDLPSGGSDFLDCSFIYCERVSSWVTYLPLLLGLYSIQPFLFRNKIVCLSIVAGWHHALTRPFIQSPQHNPVLLHPLCHVAATQSQRQRQRIRQFDDGMQVTIAFLHCLWEYLRQMDRIRWHQRRIWQTPV